MSLSCRFYRHMYPKLEDVVMVNVRSIAEMGTYVSLLEYNNIEGMIMLSELTRRRIRSINKLVRIGRNECVAVIRVDEEKGASAHTHYLVLIVMLPSCHVTGYIDLSKRRVSQEEIQKCEEKFSRAKTVSGCIQPWAFWGRIIHMSKSAPFLLPPPPLFCLWGGGGGRG